MKPFLLQNNSQEHSTLQTKHSSDGKKTEKSRLKKQKEDIEGTSMMCQTSHRPNIVRIIKNHHSSMQGSHQQNKKMTFKDKLNIPTIQISKPYNYQRHWIRHQLQMKGTHYPFGPGLWRKRTRSCGCP